MGSMDFELTIAGIAYGVLLIAATFINNRVVESFRLDVIFMKQPTPSTRIVNLVAGLAIIGYNVYTLVK
ncbi:MAG: hypothetical protein IT362_05765 [Deltaproteobacteria bacterium]|nr:hypothetical protein [Deltaproteobacteria bacterium]